MTRHSDRRICRHAVEVRQKQRIVGRRDSTSAHGWRWVCVCPPSNGGGEGGLCTKKLPGRGFHEGWSVAVRESASCLSYDLLLGCSQFFRECGGLGRGSWVRAECLCCCSQWQRTAPMAFTPSVDRLHMQPIQSREVWRVLSTAIRLYKSYHGQAVA